MSVAPHNGSSAVPPQLQASRVFLRPIANPFALGFAGLAIATLVVTGIQLHWVPGVQRHQAALFVIVTAPLLQVIACVFGFLARDATAATGMGVMSATWLSIGLSLRTSAPGSHSAALGLLLFVATAMMVFVAFTAAQTKLLPALVMLVTAVRFAFTGLFEYGQGSGWQTTAGWVGLGLCALALYAALALELEDMRHHTVFPTLRRGRGREVLDGRLADQVDQVATEAGVRGQL